MPGRNPASTFPRVRKGRVYVTGGAIGVLAALALIFTTVFAANTTEVVKPSDMNGWGFANETTNGNQIGSFVDGPGTAPLGDGSARFQVSATNEGLLLGKVAHTGLQLSDVTTMGFSTYRSSVDAGDNLAVTIQLGWDEDNTTDPSFRGRLVFEPYLAAGGGTVPQDTWQTWNPLTTTDGWYATNGALSATCSQGNSCSWAEVMTAWPNAEIDEAGFGFIGLKIGAGIAAFDGNADQFVIGTAADTWTYDFEPDCTTICYVDAATGDDSFDGETPATAKKTIQAAVNQVSPNGTVDVAAGTYDEQVVIDGKSLTLQGAGNTTVVQPSSAAVLTSVYTTGTQAGAFFNGDTIASIIDVRNVGTAGVTIQDLKVDGELVTSQPAGATRFSGITYGETGGLIDTVTVEDTGNIIPATVRSYSVWLDAVANTALSVDVIDSTAFHYGRNGLNARGDDLTVDFTDNTITGPGTAADQVPNGVLIISGATGTVTGNTITANHYSSTPTFFGSGVLLFQAGDNIAVSDNDISDVDDAVLINATDLASVTDNNLSGNLKGVRIEAGIASNNTFTGNTIDTNSLVGIELSDTVGTGNVANRNSIAGNTAGVSNASTNAFDAECNWWGSSTGPSGQGSGTGDTVSVNVDFTPWLLSAVLTSQCSEAPACETPPFTDVAVDHPFCAEIQWMKDEGISTGFADGTYRPTIAVTRQAMSAFMARLADATLTPCTEEPFTDVPITHAFCSEILWMKDEGISEGFDDGTYRPGIAVTRQAMSAFMARLADATLTPCTEEPFTDVPITHEFCSEIQWMKDAGISTGFTDGTYRPANDVTRQAMAAFMLRVSVLLP